MSNRGQVFKALRAELSQRQFAEKIGLDQSRISRIEAETAEPTMEEIDSWLGAAKPADAVKARIWLEGDWHLLSEVPPDWAHPELEVLARIAATIKQLKAIENIPEIAPQLSSYKNELLRIAGELHDLGYRAALVGASAVGKSTAEASGLDLKSPSGELVLPTGVGYTTLCEGQIERGDRWAIVVEPEPDDEIRRLVEDMCAAQQAKTEQLSEQRPAIASEVRAAILNMASLAPKTVQTAEGIPVREEPFNELIVKEGDRAASAVLILMNLSRRDRTEIMWEPAFGDPLEWQRVNLRKINKGLDPSVSLPRRVRLILGRPVFPNTSFDMTVIDTRGVVDGVVRRPDLAAALADPRTIPVLCSKFPNAPDLYVRQLLKYAAEQEFHRWDTRTVLLLLAQGDEATKVTYEDSDEFVANASEGNLIKQGQARQELRQELELSKATRIAISTYDALKDPSEKFRVAIIGRIDEMRAADIARADAIVQAATRLVGNAHQLSIIVAQNEIAAKFHSFMNEGPSLEVTSEQLRMHVLHEVRSSHHRSVWAMTRRQGVWRTLSLDLHLSDGAAQVARIGSRQIVQNQNACLDELERSENGRIAQDFVGHLKDTIESCRADFVARSRIVVSATVWRALRADLQLWHQCEQEWNRGLGFRDRVVERLSAWFNSNDLYMVDFQARLQQAWQDAFVRPLAQLCNTDIA